MRAYVSISFSNKQLLSTTLHAITETLSQFNIAAFVFVNNYSFKHTDEKQMMQQAMRDIDDCNLLIAEVSDKGIGIGVEVGYAKGKGKPVIYLRHTDAEHSTTVSGISDFHIIYADNADLQVQLSNILRSLV
ncbi:MAG: nucleoside 2-deoxyribosyltransferase [Filimonas sp.]|nr:nucleoside 2-deoxyribosyltransferase [Filimonas sp.]